ncbi:ATP-binding protein [archaeon]|jgi:hypothetical protein|nr:ATP-binding protein [archaeon]
MSKKTHGVHSIIINSIRLVLVLIFISALMTESVIVEFFSIVAIIITFLPAILHKYFKISIPAKFEVLVLMFIYGILFLGEVRTFSQVWWWDTTLTLIASLILSLTALSILYVLYKENRIDTNPLFIAILTFCFAVAAGAVWEITEFVIDAIIQSGLQPSLADTMMDQVVNAIGALIVSTVGYIYIKKDKEILISTFITRLSKRNIGLFGPKRKISQSKKAIEIINKGESETIEFKSSFRTNLHTKEFDRRMEHSVLKTITAFLNTSGGNLLVGVNDGGHILGLEADGFQSDDKLGLHLTNLIKSHIGNEYLPFIKFEIIPITDKKILRIKCKESKKRVFLKFNNEQQFFVRNGAASIRLEGEALVDYIQHKF